MFNDKFEKSKFYASFWNKLFKVNFATKVSLHFWKLLKIVRF
jgi:hypothetical protein